MQKKSNRSNVLDPKRKHPMSDIGSQYNH